MRRQVLKASLRVAGVTAAALLVANCAGNVQREGGKQDRFNKKYGVSSSPRMIKDGQPVPKGGGRAMVGKSYTVAGKRYTPVDNPNYSASGVASWYGPNFHGRMTANGEVFDKYSIAAAHPTLPLPSYVRVTNMDNGLSLVVRVNDRGPYHGRRLIDVSKRAAELLEFRQVGTARVKVDYIRRASVDGSDDTILAQTLTDGAPAQLDAGQSRVMVASAPAAAPEAPAPQATRVAEAQPSALAAGSQAEVAANPVAGQVATDTPLTLGNDPVREQLRRASSHDDSDALNALAGLPDVAPMPPERPVVLAAGR